MTKIPLKKYKIVPSFIAPKNTTPPPPKKIQKYPQIIQKRPQTLQKDLKK
jgi:hypothetical protein